jgi:hypothetical protein
MKTRKAFTIIELMLAMAFLGTMLLGIATLILQITNIYQKGLAIRGINTVGREIISDLTRTVNASRVNVDINPTGNTSKINITNVRHARAQYFVETKRANSAGKSVQAGGAFCTGSYSYVWNTAENLRAARATGSVKEGRISNAAVAGNIANNGILVVHTSDDQYIVPKLVRFVDRDRNSCLTDNLDNMAGDSANPIKKGKTYFDLTYDGVSSKDVNELIADNEADLALYDFTVLPATQNYTTRQIFYPGTFILATYRGGVNITSNGDFCQGSDKDDGTMDSSSEFTMNDFDYCAVNKFNFAIRASGETGINQHGEN